MGIDIQRGGELAVAEDTRYRCHVRTARDYQAGSGVAQAVDIELLSVDIPPLQGAAFAAPHPRGNDKLEVCLILDALIFQCSDDFLRRFFVGNLFPCFLTCVARHGSGDRTPISMEYVFSRKQDFFFTFCQFNLWVTVWDSFDPHRDPHAEMRRRGEKGAERKFGNLSDGFCYF